MPVVKGHEILIANANQAIYNGFDNCLTFEIDQVRQRSRRNDTLIYDFELGMQGPALDMMTRGFLVDMAERERAISATKIRRDNTTRVLSSIVSAVSGQYKDTFPNSGKQLADLFYDRMKLAPVERWTDGERKRPMDRETLERLESQNKWAAPVISAILLHRDLSKTIQVLETQIDSDWRWRCSYNIGGTATGRWSSSKSPFITFNEGSSAWKSTGSNLQNITEELRRIFIPDPGFKLYGIDKAQSEARDVGWFCGTVLGDWSYLDACESGDLHTYVTRMLYPNWNWTGDLKRDRQIANRRFYRSFTYRYASKQLSHASNYYGRPREISRQSRIPQNLVEEFQDRYFDAFPCIRRMHEWVAQALQRDRFLVNSFGRRRDFFDRPDIEETLKAAIAYLFQSATGDCLNLGLYRLWKRMGLGGLIQLLAQLHDAIYFQMPIVSKREEMDWLMEAVDCVQITQKFNDRSMTIPGEMTGGFNWAHRYRLLEDGTVDDWNPHGLDEIRIH